MINTIGFPGLGIGPFKIHEYFEIFGLRIHFYGVLIALGIVGAYLFCTYMGKKYDVSSETLIDIILVGLPSAVVCARIYYVAFRWNEYKDNLIDIFKIWEGGIAVYGSLIGAVGAAFIYCRHKKISFTKILDVCCYGLLIGQIIGRWGNFVNAEAYGAETNLPWRMALYDLKIYVHPTFLYESLWNLGVFLFLIWYRKYQRFSGEIFLAYLTGYGLGRLWIEALRTDSLYLGNVRISQLVAAVCAAIGIILILYFRHKKKISDTEKE